jgi:L-ascorbate metabolism protein UlaG (beta-lactamase superfamily)
MDLKGNRVTWVGHGTWIWETSEGRRIMVDPWLEGNPAAPDELKQPGSLDAILITHGHFDHTGSAVEVITGSGAPAVALFDTAQRLEGQGCSGLIGMNKGGTVEVAGIRATMVNAVHSCEEGEAAGYVIEFPDGLVVYQAGDTDVFGDMALIGELYHPEVAVLPVGGHFTMGPRQAAHAVRLLGVRQVICGHFGTFPLLAGTPAQLRELVGPDVEVPDMTPGIRLP